MLTTVYRNETFRKLKCGLNNHLKCSQFALVSYDYYL